MDPYPRYPMLLFWVASAEGPVTSVAKFLPFWFGSSMGQALICKTTTAQGSPVGRAVTNGFPARIYIQEVVWNRGDRKFITWSHSIYNRRTTIIST